MKGQLAHLVGFNLHIIIRLAKFWIWGPMLLLLIPLFPLVWVIGWITQAKIDYDKKVSQ